ncbi:MAG TPA: quinolinate synthase NadA [Povalibacter sp.]|uniref:quinolinate synthase NadA n=1 Tax=Povalibacter sp. TaxID=1962978 RepID=UPI002C8D3B7B|nr:quinolinate synthase NadA [Povalibacter sp.]HMN46371.1 quinolinate synthase NadA [Povalibacter sp.]
MQTKLPPYTHREHAARYSRVVRLMPSMEWDAYFDLVKQIQALKRDRNAIVLAHNYQRPEIFHAVADIQGDSLTLAREGAKSRADVIVMCGVRFMAETAKILSPEKTVLLPSPNAGCSLADSITAADVRALRARHPGTPVVCYVNTDAAVKAECDACCTSANAIEIVEGLGADQAIFVPDAYLAAYVAAHSKVQIIPWRGRCEVHERFTAGEIEEYRRTTGAYVIAHPECPPEVQAVADYVGSTSGMIAALRRRQPARAVLVTECSMADNVCSEFPETEFVRPCNLCPHMQSITLPGILRALVDLQPAIEVPADIAARARRSIDRMLELTARHAA